jgi:hypothetical protein
MAQGNYDHPSYLTRQQIHLGATTAAATGTSCRMAPISNLRIRNVLATVQTAGTFTGGTAGFAVYVNTTSLGTITLSTNLAGYTGSSGDLNTTLTAGTGNANQFYVICNGDATLVARLTLEAYLDPSATWTGQN